MVTAPGMDRSTETPAWKSVLLYVFAALFGAACILIMWLIPFVGPTIGFLSVQLTKPRPERAGKQGAIAGAISAAAMLAAWFVFIGLYVSDLGLMAIFAIYTIGFSALTAHFIGRRRPVRDPENLEDQYQPVEPSHGYITVACRSCGAKQQVAVSAFGRSNEMDHQQSMGAENTIEITSSGQHFYDMSHLSKGAGAGIGIFYLLMAAAISNPIIAFLGGGDAVTLVVWNIALVAIITVMYKPLTRLSGRKIPVWLVSCPGCREKTAVATDGKAFFISTGSQLSAQEQLR